MVLRALGLGDLLTAVPALRALARAFPDHERVLVAPRALGPLVRLIDADGGPAVHRIEDHTGLDQPLPEALAAPDVAVNLHGRGPQSHARLRALEPGRLIASGDDVPWRDGEHEVQRWCRLLTEHGIPADPADLVLAAPDLSTLQGRLRGATVVHPGAASPARRWPADRFAAVVRAEAQAGREVVLTGGAAERELARDVAAEAGLGLGAVLAGVTDLHALTLVVAGAGRVVCGDTGIAHLATALGTPSVVLFGPVSPAEWGPPAGGDRHVALHAAQPGERGDPHGQQVDPALARLQVPAVLEALERLSAAA